MARAKFAKDNVIKNVNYQDNQEPSEKSPVEDKKENVSAMGTNDHLMQMISDLQAQISAMKNIQEPQMHTPNITSSKEVDLNRWVTVIHLLDNTEGLTTHITLNNREVDLRRFGDTVRLRLPDFEELFYKYHTWFENNMIGITNADKDLEEIFGIVSSENLPINSAILSKIHEMSDEAIETLWGKLSDVHKDLIVKKWAINYFDPDPKTGKFPKNDVFKNKKKLRFLNDISQNAFQRILDDIEYREYEEKKGGQN